MISFALTEDQRIAQAMASEFAKAVGRPAARAADESGTFAEALIARAWALGLVQATATRQNCEQPSLLNALMLEEIAHGDAALAVALAAPLGFARAVAEHGSPAQQATHLPIFTKETPCFAAIANTNTGWFAQAGTRARRTVGGWRIDGAKAMIPLAGRCNRFLVTAATDEGEEAFIVPASASGVNIGPSLGTLGLRALQMADVAFADVFAPESERLQGSVRRIVDLSRVALCAVLGGLARAVYDYALPYAKERVVHGQAIGRKQAIAFKLADMRIATQAISWMGLRAASEMDAGLAATRNARLAQRYSADKGLGIADEGVQIFGGHGFIRDLPVEMWYRNARTLSVLDGLVGV